MLKAAYGGGGRGMRVVNEEKDLGKMFELASSEAKAAFGDGSMFIERFVGMFILIQRKILVTTIDYHDCQ